MLFCCFLVRIFSSEYALTMLATDNPISAFGMGSKNLRIFAGDLKVSPLNGKKNEKTITEYSESTKINVRGVR